MAYVNVYLPDEVYEQWRNDPKKKGLISKLTCEYYGFEVLKARVVKKTKVSRYDKFKPINEL